MKCSIATLGQNYFGSRGQKNTLKIKKIKFPVVGINGKKCAKDKEYVSNTMV